MQFDEYTNWIVAKQRMKEDQARAELYRQLPRRPSASRLRASRVIRGIAADLLHVAAIVLRAIVVAR